MAEQTLLHIENIKDSLLIEYHADEIIVFRPSDMRRYTVDTWCNIWEHQERQAVAAHKHIKRLVDLRYAGFPTPYSTAKAFDLSQASPRELIESVAILVADNMMYQLVDRIVRRLPLGPTSTLQFFRLESEAIGWLQTR